jgi:hypothetical protein
MGFQLPRSVFGGIPSSMLTSQHMSSYERCRTLFRFKGSQAAQRFGPGLETSLKRGWVQIPKDAAEGVMRWNAVRQRQEALEPGSLRLTEHLDINPVVSPTDHRTEGDTDDAEQWMLHVLSAARIGQPSKVPFNTRAGRLGHRCAPFSQRFSSPAPQYAIALTRHPGLTQVNQEETDN